MGHIGNARLLKQCIAVISVRITGVIMAVYPLDGVTYYISELLVGTGTEGSSTGRRRC